MAPIKVTTGPALDRLRTAVNEYQGFYPGLIEMISKGELPEIIKDLSDMAKTMQKAGYVPPEMPAEKRKQLDYHNKLAKSVQDKEVAAYHRERARQIAVQIGEDVQV
jgi:hypothetical protein